MRRNENFGGTEILISLMKFSSIFNGVDNVFQTFAKINRNNNQNISYRGDSVTLVCLASTEQQITSNSLT